MEVGICVASHIGDIDYVVRAEELLLGAVPTTINLATAAAPAAILLPAT